MVAKPDKDNTRKENYLTIYLINIGANNPKLDIIKLNLETY